MDAGALPVWVVSVLLLSLRVAPLFAFAPPFTLVRTPPLFRALFGIAVAACLAAADPQSALVADLEPGTLVAAGVRELLLGTVFVLVLQMLFAALGFTGRTIDIQAGLGLAVLIDPATRAQTPLVGALFGYVAGALFFAVDGHLSLLRILAASLEAAPVGGYALPSTIAPMTLFIGAIFALGLGVGGAAILSLFLADLAIAFLARTVPQMNVLILGLQVKALLLLVALPVTLGVAGGLIAQMVAVTLEAMPRVA